MQTECRATERALSEAIVPAKVIVLIYMFSRKHETLAQFYRKVFQNVQAEKIEDAKRWADEMAI